MKLFILLFFFSLKLVASDKPPFLNLYQYFSFKIIDSQNFKINNTLYSIENIVITLSPSEVRLMFKNLSSFKSAQTQIEVIDLSGNKVTSIPLNSDKDELTTTLSLDLKKTKHICIVGQNEFTSKRMCKRIVSENTAGLLRASANGSLLEPHGKIILNKKNTNLNFRIENADFFFDLTTRNKNIITNRAYKFKDSNSIQTEFVDAVQPNKYSFKRRIQLQDTFFEIDLDDLLTIYQDIVFTDKDLLKKSVDYELKALVVKKYRKFGIEPIGLYLLLNVESASLQANMVSELSQGIKMYFSKYNNNKQESFYAAKFVLLQVRDDFNNNVISNNNLSLFQLTGGVRYYQTSSLQYALSLNLKELIYAESLTSPTTLGLVKALSPSLSLSVNSIFFEKERFRVNASGSISLIAPSSISSGQTQLASSLSFGAEISYKLRGGRVYYGTDYSAFKTSNSVYKFGHQTFEHIVGFLYLY